MPNEPQRIFANTIRARTTAAELVLEFGTFLPMSEDEAKAGVPKDFAFDVQVILGISQLQAFSDSLQTILRHVTAAKAAEAAHNQTPQKTVKTQ